MLTPLFLPVAPAQADEFLSEPGPAVADALGAIEGGILVLGAGGKMGLHVCSMIRRADASAGRPARVTAVSRFSSVHGRAEFERAGIPAVACDLEDDAALAALPDAPNVIFMAGAKFGTAGNPGLLDRMNVRLPERVAARFARSRFLVFSTGCVYSMVPPESGGSTEEDPTDPPGDYAKSCLGRERAFVAAARDRGTASVLIRLNYATEFRYGVLVDIARKVLRGEPVDVSMGWVNVIWQRDAVEHILRAFPLADAPPAVLNVTGPGIARVGDLASDFGALFGREPRLEGREAPTAWLNNASRSHALFGPPPTDLVTMIGWTAAWVRDVGVDFGKPTGFEKRDGTF